MRGSPQTVPENLAVSIRLRLTAYRPLALCRSCACQRGCFAGLTQGLLRRFPRFTHTLSRAGGPGRSAVVCAAYQIVDGHVEMVCQFPNGFYSRIILSTFQFLVMPLGYPYIRSNLDLCFTKFLPQFF